VAVRTFCPARLAWPDAQCGDRALPRASGTRSVPGCRDFRNDRSQRSDPPT
jgi:hypothetical protein